MDGAYRILVVEDNPGDVFLLRQALKKAGLDGEITTIADGATALGYVRREAPYETTPLPHLAVLDMNLPKKDGTEVLQAMRQSPEFQNVPVVMMSSSASARDQARTAQLGGTRYLTKPMDLDDYLKLGEVLKSILLAGQPSGLS